MMLDHVGEVERARRIRDAIAGVVKQGTVRTYDMMNIPGGAQSIAQGAASTVQMTDAVLAKLPEQPQSEGPSRERVELAEVGHT
jgi:3-isopropylmalate dehydrogenase